MAVPAVERKILTSSSDALYETPYMGFADGEIDACWEMLDPMFQDPRLYKVEPKIRLEVRHALGLTNFQQIGGNPVTRPQLPFAGDNFFVEASWITPNMIAAGYPTGFSAASCLTTNPGIMRANYWCMVDTLRKTHSLFLVNFMHQVDVANYGGWFFPTEDKPEMNVAIGEWKGKITYECTENHIGWNMHILKMGDSFIPLYDYSYWKDHGDGETSIIIDILQDLYDDMHKAGIINPLEISNCRGGVGRTGTFTILLYFYGLLKEKKPLDKRDFNLAAILKKIVEFREARGDVQFVQSKPQFIMLCRIIENLFNEAMRLTA